MAPLTDNDRRTMVRAWQESGLDLVTWCARNHTSPRTFRSWRQRLCPEGQAAPERPAGDSNVAAALQEFEARLGALERGLDGVQAAVAACRAAADAGGRQLQHPDGALDGAAVRSGVGGHPVAGGNPASGPVEHRDRPGADLEEHEPAIATGEGVPIPAVERQPQPAAKPRKRFYDDFHGGPESAAGAEEPIPVAPTEGQAAVHDDLPPADGGVARDLATSQPVVRPLALPRPSGGFLTF